MPQKVPVVLIVEDNIMWANRIMALLQSSDYRFDCHTVTTQEDAVEFLSRIDVTLAIIDLNLSDSDMQNMEGFRIIRWLIETQSKTKVIILSAFPVGALVEVVKDSDVLIDSFQKYDLSIDSVHSAINRAVGITNEFD
jgi:DNA-binding response OmpR family regulator